MSITEKLLTSKNALASLLTFANAKTGKDDPDIGEAIKTLVDGYGQGGGGLLGMLDRCYAYGTCSIHGEYATQQNLYIGFPMLTYFYIIAHERDTVGGKAGRPVHIAHATLFATALTQSGSINAWQVLSIPQSYPFFNTYPVTIFRVGKHNDHIVSRIGYPAQGIALPTGGIDLTFFAFKPKGAAAGTYPNFNDAKINCIDMPSDTWISLSGSDEFYLGFTAPEVDAE